jgi:prepilin-type N-terminal cleavage/methylation domain-containing protein
MNRKGFTLVELVATIALLAVIAIISFVSINGVINQSKVSNCNDLVNNIKIAAKEYVSDNRYKLENNNDLNITAQKLVDDNYLSSPIVNPFNNENIEPNDISIKIELNNDYTAKKVEIKAPAILVECKSE